MPGKRKLFAFCNTFGLWCVKRHANMGAEGLLIKRTPKFVEERSMERVRDGAAWREGGWE